MGEHPVPRAARWMRFARAALALAGAAAAGLPAMAQAADTFPDKPIRIIFPFAPGGGGDFVARFIAQRLTEALGQSVYVENRPGAGGMTGTDAGVRMAPDGYNLILISNSYTVNPSVYKVKFDPVGDITPIVQISQGPLLIVTNPKFPAKTTQDLIALAKAKPGSINFGSGGVGSVVHFAAERFASMAGVKMTHVPYKSTGLAVTDVIGGQVDLSFSSTASSLQSVKSGMLHAVAVTGKERLPALPDVPTVAESGLPGYEVTLWHGLIGPKDMPPAVVQRINIEVNKILKMPETAKRLESEGVVPAGGSPADFKRLISQEVTVWKQVAQDAGVKAN
jgi:tripartite-type tricarboxylate transporter receptor subunit TctC